MSTPAFRLVADLIGQTAKCHCTLLHCCSHSMIKSCSCPTLAVHSVQGVLPLFGAAMNEHSDLLEHLLSQGILDANAKDSHVTPFPFSPPSFLPPALHPPTTTAYCDHGGWQHSLPSLHWKLNICARGCPLAASEFLAERNNTATQSCCYVVAYPSTWLAYTHQF